jgi:hypothetical protein
LPLDYYRHVFFLGFFYLCVQFLQSNFGNLKPYQVDQLCRNISIESFDANRLVFRQGDRGDKFYVVFTGKVGIDVTQQIAGRISSEVRVTELARGEYFGERALHNNEPRAATVTALQPTELLTIARDDYNRILRDSQEDFLNKIRGQTGLQMVSLHVVAAATSHHLECISRTLWPWLNIVQGKRFQSQKDRCREILQKPGFYYVARAGRGTSE